MGFRVEIRGAAALAALAVAVSACADSVAPRSGLLPATPSLTITNELYDLLSGPFPEGMHGGEVRLCKAVSSGDPGATFNFTVTTNGAGTLPDATPTLVVPAGDTACVIVYTSLIGNGGGAEQVVITEDPDQTDWDLVDIDTRRLLGQGMFNAGLYTAPRLDDAEDFANRKATVYANNDMARIVTFLNDFTPPTGCTYTKGWYQNKNGAPTVIAVDGRTKSEAQTIFASTPGKPNGVTWGSDNLLHNLYQQLLAALQNLGGDANEDNGPAAVDAAIDAAQDGTGGTGLNITTTLTHDQMAALVTVLTAFNEGTYAGWPHCRTD